MLVKSRWFAETRLNFLLLLLLLLLSVCAFEVKKSKITEGVEPRPELSEYSNVGSPAEISGPIALQFLSTVCLNASLDRYEYSLCPFHNITQRRVVGQRGIVIGVWDHWIDDKTMKFGRGDSCGPSNDRETVVHIECDHSDGFEILSIEETETCKYTARLGVPLPCTLLTDQYFVEEDDQDGENESVEGENGKEDDVKEDKGGNERENKTSADTRDVSVENTSVDRTKAEVTDSTTARPISASDVNVASITSTMKAETPSMEISHALFNHNLPVIIKLNELMQKVDQMSEQLSQLLEQSDYFYQQQTAEDGNVYEHFD